MRKYKKEIPVFFAADKNYLPFLSVALTALTAHASKNYFYRVHVLHDGKDLGEDTQKIFDMQTKNCSVAFFDVAERLKEIADVTHCRDYYTNAIFYRLFIPDAFPQYDKAIYFDCDTVLLADVAELFDIDIGDNLVGAVADQAVASVPAFCDYTKNALGIAPDKYFNSGVLTMNLKRLREMNFCDCFTSVLRSYKFIVAPDQDALNLICKNKVHYYAKSWNAMPSAEKKLEVLKLVHYNLCLKPWYYEGVPYGEYFWQYAEQTPFFAEIKAKRAAFTPERREADERSTQNLIALAQAEADSPHNYLKSVVLKVQPKMENEGGMYGFIEDFTRKASLT